MALTNIEIETMNLIKSACRCFIEKSNRVKKMKLFEDVTEMEEFSKNVNVDAVTKADVYILTYYEK